MLLTSHDTSTCSMLRRTPNSLGHAASGSQYFALDSILWMGSFLAKKKAGNTGKNSQYINGFQTISGTARRWSAQYINGFQTISGTRRRWSAEQLQWQQKATYVRSGTFKSITVSKGDQGINLTDDSSIEGVPE